ncbi:hypothetical protein LINPERPRIM_LOCUS21194 [Linum perenne]
MSRSWHIHRAPLILRRWYSDIEPIDFSADKKPVWIELQGVPPELIYSEGISWLATQYGKPISKFVRDGLKVSVCVLRGEKDIERPALFVDIGNEEFAEVNVKVLAARQYNQKPRRQWEARPQQKHSGTVKVTSGNGAKASSEVEATPESLKSHPAGGGEGNLPKIPQGMEGEPSQQGDSIKASEVEIISLSPKSSRKKNKKGKASSVSEASSQLLISPVSVSAPGNVVEPLTEGEASPEPHANQGAGGGLGNSSEISMEVDDEPKQQQEAEAVQAEAVLLSSKTDAEGNKDSTLLLGGFMANKKVFASPVKGCVLTRQQQNRRKR